MIFPNFQTDTCTRRYMQHMQVAEDLARLRGEVNGLKSGLVSCQLAIQEMALFRLIISQLIIGYH